MKPCHRNLILLTVVLFITNLSAYSQCEYGDLCRIAIGDAGNDRIKKRLLYDNWTDFHGVDLENEFPLVKGTQLNVVSVRLDGLGCIYPSFINDTTYRKDFIDESVEQTKYDKLSFYRLFLKHPNLLDGHASPAQISAINAICNENDSCFAARVFAFRDLWNSKFLPAKIASIQDLIRVKKIKRVYFFIHGFNVPSSLAHLQGNAFFRAVLEQDKMNSDEILFVRVFWPSFSEKRRDFLDSNCDIRNNEIKVVKSGLFSFISNRAYLCGLSLNRIVDSLPDNIQYNIISHSFGSTLAAATILSAQNKIDSDEWHTPYNTRLINAFNKMGSLKYKEINFFMHAPGMPGKATFGRMDPADQLKHFFYIGHNKKDKISLKKAGPFTFSRKLSSTSLGANRWGEVKRVMKLAKKKKLGDNFKQARTSKLNEHDIFCYMQQPGFKNFFSEYLNHVSR